ncbi:MAG TPA: hypothetical protein VIH71_07465 [Solirubrobacteraceae bacterium]
MRITSIKLPRRHILAIGCVLVVLAAMPVTGAVGDTSPQVSPNANVAGTSGTGLGSNGAPKVDATATVEQCLNASLQSERAATFVGEMSAIAGTSRMEISIGLLERTPGEGPYRLVSAFGLGGWRGSATGVKTYTYIKQVTDLAAPAFYRGAVRFRWLNAKGHVIKAEELRTTRCEQAAAPSTGTGTSTTGSTTTSNGTATTVGSG